MVDLDDFKNTWAAYDKKLDDSLKLNQELLKKLNLDKSSRELNKLLVYEQVGVVFMVTSLGYMLYGTLKVTGESKFLIPGIANCIILAIMACFSVKKVQMISKIDYTSTAVLRLQQLVNQFNLSYIKMRKWEFIMMPIFCITLPPILWKTAKNYDAYEHLLRLGIATSLGFAAACATAYLVYYKWYDKKIKKASAFLGELEQYKIE